MRLKIGFQSGKPKKKRENALAKSVKIISDSNYALVH